MASDLPSIPPVMTRGDQVIYTAEGAHDLLALLRIGLQVVEQQAARNAMTVPIRHRLIVQAAEIAAASAGPDMRTSSDVRESRTQPLSYSGRYVGVAEAAGLWNVDVRQARRRMAQAGGAKTTKGWRIREDLLHADIELRRSA